MSYYSTLASMPWELPFYIQNDISHFMEIQSLLKSNDSEQSKYGDQMKIGKEILEELLIGKVRRCEFETIGQFLSSWTELNKSSPLCKVKDFFGFTKKNKKKKKTEIEKKKQIY